MEKELIKGTKIFKFFSSVPSSFRMELVPVQFLKKGTSSRNFRSLNEFLTQTEPTLASSRGRLEPLS